MSGWIDFRCTICGELRRQPLEPLGHEVVNGPLRPLPAK